MADTLPERDLLALEKVFVDAMGRGFEPATKRSRLLERAAKAGLVRRVDERFFSERKKKLVVFTDAGRAVIVRRLASKRHLSQEDVLHLVRTGSYSLALKPASPMQKSAHEEVQYEAF